MSYAINPKYFAYPRLLYPIRALVTRKKSSVCDSKVFLDLGTCTPIEGAHYRLHAIRKTASSQHDGADALVVRLDRDTGN